MAGGDPEIPAWLKGLPLAPVYRPTETEFADPIAFISRIEREAAAFGICKVIPPLPRPSKRFVLANLNRSLAKSPELGPAPSRSHAHAAVFTTRQQELGSRRQAAPAARKQVWQSGEVYTLEQFEAKSRSFARSHLGGLKEVTPLLIEALFWKAITEKPIYIEYANDVPGSGFSAPEEPGPYRFHHHHRRRKDGSGSHSPVAPSSSHGVPHEDWQGTAGWRLSNSPWNLQVIARSAGSLTRFMPDDVPGVTSPMVYVGMLFSWFAWHVEDHELHSMNYLHMGSPKTWFAVPGEFATTLEDIVRTQGYGGNMDHLAAFTMLGEKTTLISPQVFVTAGVPCCRLVQHPGEFVVTFPRAYHVGFSHGFNCGEAANFATPQWLTVAKEAAVRRAATNHLPMLSHQQLLYILTMSFIFRIPRELPGVRSSRLQDRKKEDTEFLVKKSFLTDIARENHLLHLLLGKESTSYAVLWEPELLPSSYIASRPFSSSLSPEANGTMDYGRRREMGLYNLNVMTSFDCNRGNYSTGSMPHEVCSNLTSLPCQDMSSVDTPTAAYRESKSSSKAETKEGIDVEEGDLPIGLSVDSGSLPCVSCGILGYPFMAVIQPSERALSELFSGNYEEFYQKFGKTSCPNLHPSMPSKARKLNSEATTEFEVQGNPDLTFMFNPAVNGHLFPTEGHDTNCSFTLLDSEFKDTSPNIVKMQDAVNGHQMGSTSHRVFQSSNDLLNKIKYSNGLHHGQLKELNTYIHMKDNAIVENDSSCTNFSGNRYETDRLLGAPGTKSGHVVSRKWNKSNGFTRPRIFCLQHALEIVELLQCKGGANVLITCHSDFVTIKEHALAVAEEIGVPFNYKDIQLEYASPEDLDLICFSIDDDDHNQPGEDWTSNLGLNLKYCLKMRKHTSVNKDCLTLGLGRIFSDTLPVSVGSGLKWHSRKSRTPYKIIGSVQSKPPCNAIMEKAKPIINKSNDNSMKKIQVYHSRGSGSGDITKTPHDSETNGMSSEFSNCTETGILIDWDVDRSLSNHSYILNKEDGKDNAEDMLAIPFLNADKTLMRQDDWTAETVSIPWDASAAKPEDLTVHADTAIEPHRRRLNIQLPDKFNNVEADCDPMESERHGPYAKHLTFGKSEMPCSIHSSTEPSTFCKIGTSEELPDAEKVTPRNYSEDMHKDRVSLMPNFEGSFCHSVFSDYQSSLPAIPSCNSDLQVMFSTVGKPKMENSQAEAENIKQGQGVISPRKNNLVPENLFIDDNRIINSHGKQQKSSLNSEMEQFCNSSDSVESLGHILNAAPVKICERESQTLFCEEVSLTPRIDHPEILAMTVPSAAGKVSETQYVVDNTVGINTTRVNDHAYGTEKNIDKVTRIVFKSYVRRNKRKSKVEQITDSHNNCNIFVRSPCEGLRPRSRQVVSERAEVRTVNKATVKGTEGADSAVCQGKEKTGVPYECDLEGCHMTFTNRGELMLHRRNHCPNKRRRKQLSSQQCAIRHQCAHDDNMPLKCPWKGCRMSFKWAWARTEHVRLHTGERPYKCKVEGCGLTFRFVSDFSRHRRKSGHSANSPDR